MKPFLFSLLAIVLLASCAGDNSSKPPSDEKVKVSRLVEGGNSHPIVVGGKTSICTSAENSLCTTIKICIPSTTTCTTISDILVDTGSNGLRVFESALGALALPTIAQGGNQLLQCAHFGSGNTWGPIKSAGVVLAQENAVTVPVQIIESTTVPAPAACSSLIATPTQFGFNGILGVGLFEQDCGATCAAAPNNQTYYTCPAGVCDDLITPLNKQVTNPVSVLPGNNNGVYVALPDVPETGAFQADGSLVLGIDTAANNASTGKKLYQADGQGDFTVVFAGQTYTGSHIDSGSNGWFFPTGLGVPACPADSIAAVGYCPSPTASLSLTATGLAPSTSSEVFFKIANAVDLVTTQNVAFNNLGLKLGGKFIMGLPFFYGRDVYVGIENKASTLGTGPYWAF